MATGVLVLAIGEGTKLVQYLTAAKKLYRGTVRFGELTDTLDAEGEVTDSAPVPQLGEATLKESLLVFHGALRQQVPKVSAVRVGGQRLHKLARAGVDVELPVKDVEVFDLRLLGHGTDWGEVELLVSKGFYVRSFARDWARSLGTLGHLTQLRRLQSGQFSIDRACPQSALASAAGAGTPPPDLVSLPDACAFAARVYLSPQGVADARHGRIVAPSDGRLANPTPSSADVYALLDPAGEMVAIAERQEDGWRILRGFPLEARTS
jgi:tRNA pseudouridine55 synthase